MLDGVAIFDLVGAVAFLIAFCGALKNYHLTKGISSYWLIFAVAAFMGFAWAGSVAIEWLGFYPAVMDDIEQSIIASAATAFAIAALSTAISIIKPTRQ